MAKKHKMTASDVARINRAKPLQKTDASFHPGATIEEKKLQSSINDGATFLNGGKMTLERRKATERLVAKQRASLTKLRRARGRK